MSQFVRTGALSHFFEVAREHGINPQPLLRQAGLSRALLQDPEQRIPAASAVALLELAAQATGDLGFGLRMAQMREVSDFGVVSLVISHQPTLRDALQATISYIHLINESLALQLEDTGSMVIVREELVRHAHARQANELAIGVLFRLCAAVLGGSWRPYSVNFTHASPPDTSLHQRVFGCRLEFDSDFNGLVCRGKDLDTLNPLAAPVLARYAQRYVDSLPQAGDASVLQEVRKAIYLMLGSGLASSDYVAQSLGISVRTMQRQLDEADASFTGLLTEVRRDLVQHYLDNPRHSLVRISQMLGYGSPSAFTRWFVAQFGLPPQRWRQDRRPARSVDRPPAIQSDPGPPARARSRKPRSR